MSLIPARWRRPVATTSPEVGEVGVGGADRRSDRIFAPKGQIVWVCATSTGRVGCAHETEAQAKWHGKADGRVWWPVMIDEGYGERSA